MKKIYLQPNTEVIMVELQNMIAESRQVSVGGSYNGNSSIESRRNDSFWEDED